MRGRAGFTEVGYLAMSGRIVDATIVAGPKQRDTDAEKADIATGKVPDASWEEKPAKLRQKDRDARWTVKFSKARAAEEGQTQQRDIAIPAFGYSSGDRCDRVQAAQDLLAFVDLSSGDLDVEDHAAFVVNGAVLLVARLQTSGAPRCRHARIRIGEADLLELAGLPGMPLRLPRGLASIAIDLVAAISVAAPGGVGDIAVCIADRLDMADGQALPGHVGADQRGVDMNYLAFGDPGLDAGADGPLEDRSDARARRVH